MRTGTVLLVAISAAAFVSIIAIIVMTRPLSSIGMVMNSAIEDNTLGLATIRGRSPNEGDARNVVRTIIKDCLGQAIGVPRMGDTCNEFKSEWKDAWTSPEDKCQRCVAAAQTTNNDCGAVMSCIVQGMCPNSMLSSCHPH